MLLSFISCRIGKLASRSTLLLLAGFTLACLSHLKEATANERPNVLLITADDLGLQLGCYGDTAIETPNLDRLAESGTLFETAYVTQASCSPSRSSMFSGMYPHTNGQYGLLNADVGFQLHDFVQKQTIPVLLKKAGYRTGIIGKLHVGPESSFPFDNRYRVDGRDVEKIANTVAPFMNEEEPFFLMVNYTDPHVARSSRQSSERYFPNQLKGHPKTPKQVGEVPPFPFQQIDTPEQMKRVTGYYNTVLRVDDGIGLLMQKLEDSGKRDNTLIIFVGDHGPPFDRGKTTCYEAGLRVPFLVSWPQMEQIPRSSSFVSTVDILPTILDATSLDQPENLQGKSLKPVLTGDDASWRSFLAGEFHYHGSTPFFPRRAIRDQRFKLIHNLLAGSRKPNQGIDGDKAARFSQQDSVPAEVKRAFQTYANPTEFELYDLQADPWEFRNLAELPEYQSELARMQDALMNWRKETDDPLLTEEGTKPIAEYESRKRK
ncbi:Arylsulfatase [Thalassoglobus neptunius]|uniref:Arylsulfatase n=1 Tax=Thalassoglobus neptunius TaxID=1938619 RepID=A0A5C5X233_9PLAN|nr:sulfatase [Thalassoglobus neptunius]TWT56986.1 Arylsulfatase [Thalassoglobus neptunius]